MGGLAGCSDEAEAPRHSPGVDSGLDGTVTPDSGAGVEAGAADASPEASADASADAGRLPQTANSPRVVSSSPKEGEAFYAVRMESNEPPATGYGYRQRVTLTFDRPMDTAYATMTLHGPNDDEVSFDGVWDDGATTLIAEIPLRQLHLPGSGASVLPLTYEATYRVELPELRSAVGDGVHATDDYLKDGALDFTTLPKNGLVDHTCFHTFDQVSQTLALSPTADDAPSFDSSHTHKRYLTVFQGESTPRTGNALLPISRPSLRHIFLPQDVTIQVFDLDGAPIESTVVPVPDICSLRYDHQVRFTAAGTYRLQFGPSPLETLEVYFESGSL